ncbi:hypothetical protein BIU88_09515 [Chlorobaculum limnaeum]|uniref:Uncharacterized protein n=1 Tax=Chlorobaculum limnaeum TaxID=274537 RepID=A0A1D8D3M7_CHLLM|nr:hypothetical protein [Chlorobaculum limnaeum]AOS84345.1 hypothetical protein BIU88_09515 [Chlorobaculum limnaeum]
MENIRLDLHPTTIPEWDAEDEMANVLADRETVKASEAESKEMLEAMRLELPRVEDLKQVKLLKYAQQLPTPLQLSIPPDSERYDFYQIELPLTILVPNLCLKRLRMRLELEASGQKTTQIVAYDLFPNDEYDVKTIMTGEANLDVSKTLKYFLSAIGAGAAAASMSDCFGFKLELPFKWTSNYAKVQTSDRMSNPVEWYVTDSSIQNGFTGYVIIRAPRDSDVTVVASISCQLRQKGPLGTFLKAHYMTDSYIYRLRG